MIKLSTIVFTYIHTYTHIHAIVWVYFFHLRFASILLHLNRMIAPLCSLYLCTYVWVAHVQFSSTYLDYLVKFYYYVKWIEQDKKKSIRPATRTHTYTRKSRNVSYSSQNVYAVGFGVTVRTQLNSIDMKLKLFLPKAFK